MKYMKNYIRALEVPFYLLVIALAALEKGYIGLTIFLCVVSISRLIVNTITDEYIYKK